MIKKVDFGNSRDDKIYYSGIAIIKKNNVIDYISKDLSKVLKKYKKQYGVIKKTGSYIADNKIIPQLLFKHNVSDKVIKYIAMRYMKNKVQLYSRYRKTVTESK